MSMYRQHNSNELVLCIRHSRLIRILELASLILCWMNIFSSQQISLLALSYLILCREQSPL